MCNKDLHKNVVEVKVQYLSFKSSTFKVICFQKIYVYQKMYVLSKNLLNCSTSKFTLLLSTTGYNNSLIEPLIRLKFEYIFCYFKGLTIICLNMDCTCVPVQMKTVM